MKTLTMKIVGLIVVAFMVTMIVSQIVIKLNVEYKIESALPYNATKTYTFHGVFIRDEKIIDQVPVGVLSYTGEDGSKVARNSVIANVYATRADVENQRAIDEIDKKIASLQDAQSLVGADSSQLEAFNKQIGERHSLYMQYLQAGDYVNATTLKDELFTLYSKKRIIEGKTPNYTAEIHELEQQKSAKLNLFSSAPTQFISTEPGYFVSKIDGYESLLSKDNIDSLTEEQILNAIAHPDISDTLSTVYVGKLIDTYKWTAVAIVDADVFSDAHAGTELVLRAGTQGSLLNVIVMKNEKISDEKCKITFTSDLFNADLASQRTSQFKLILGDYSGIRIARSAIRTVANAEGENEQGVYVKVGAQVFFRKIDILYWEDDYVIVKNELKPDCLALYDAYVVKGMDLYDGKVIQ